MAIGEYTIFADNDDWLEPTMLDDLYTKIKTENYDMVCCDFLHEYNYETIYRKQDTKDRTNIELIAAIIAWENFWDFLPVTWNKLVRTDIYKGIVYPKITYSEDRAVMVQVLYFCNKIGYINKGLYHWRSLEVSASRNDKKKIQNIIEDYVSYTEILLFVIENKINVVNLKKEIINHVDYMGFLCWDNKAILDIYKNSINKIYELKTKNELTQEILLSEQNYIAREIKRLNKINYTKTFRRIKLFVKRIIPKKIKSKIKKLLKHGHGT